MNAAEYSQISCDVMPNKSAVEEVDNSKIDIRFDVNSNIGEHFQIPLIGMSNRCDVGETDVSKISISFDVNTNTEEYLKYHSFNW